MNILAISPYSGYYSGVFEYLEEEFDVNPDTKFEKINAPNYCVYGKNKKLETKKQTLFILLCNCLDFFYHLMKRCFISYDVVLLASHQVAIPYLFLVKIFPFLAPKQKILIFSFFLHSMGNSNRVQRFLRLILKNNSIHMIVQSASEIEYYAKLSSQMKITMFPFCAAEPSVECIPPEMDGYIFSGGGTNRDYDCLIRAAKKIQKEFVIICSHSNVIRDEADNVVILKDQPPEVFFGYLKHSKMIVLPLKERVGASGQMVALRAMCYKKPVIYTNFDTVSIYFQDGISGISHKKGDAIDLAEKIQLLIDNPEKQEKFGNKAYQDFLEHFHIDRFMEFLIEQIFS